MRRFADKVIITNLPSFYKINLYNEIGKSCKILVIYTWNHSHGRNKDFYEGTMQFDHIHLKSSGIKRLFKLIKILSNTQYKELILGGWDSLPLWVGAFFSRRKNNALVVESSYLESTTKGVKGFIKKIFISRISKVYASGKAQKKLIESLGFKGKTIITKGVGVFNYISQPPYTEKKTVSRFLYVGRLTAVKNLELLIRVFNTLPHLTLTIVGFGELEEHLRSIANSNITFTGAIDNKELYKIYQAHDVFILPSVSEVWGLVVEEALNNGIPVIVSNRVGCADEIIHVGENGLIFENNSTDSLRSRIEDIQNIDLYNSMRKNISSLDFKQISQKQIKCYL